MRPCQHYTAKLCYSDHSKPPNMCQQWVFCQNQAMQEGINRNQPGPNKSKTPALILPVHRVPDHHSHLLPTASSSSFLRSSSQTLLLSPTLTSKSAIGPFVPQNNPPKVANPLVILRTLSPSRALTSASILSFTHFTLSFSISLPSLQSKHFSGMSFSLTSCGSLETASGLTIWPQNR